MKKIALSFTEGRVVRDLFQNGLLDLLTSNSISVDLFTPAERVKSFTQQWEQPSIKFFPLKPRNMGRKEFWTREFRKRVINKTPGLLPNWLKFEYQRLIKPDPELIEILRNEKPDLVVLTNPILHYELPFFHAAHTLGIPTLGIIRSWDNFYKGLSFHPDTLAVWNPINHAEAVNLMKYAPENVKIIGSTQFDPYFSPDPIWSRKIFAKKMKFNADKPIITIATLGAFQHQYDETYLLDWLIGAIEEDIIPADIQVVCRLHPTSRLEHFLKYKSYPNIRLSFIDGYIPSLSWVMSREDVVFVANLLHHSDVVISPGSTITIETAIFDTPIIVPVFHIYQPELGDLQYNHHLSTHFKRLQELDLIPITKSSEELGEMINKSLNNPEWYQNERKKLVEDYIYYTDGHSTQRLLNLIIDLL